MSSFQAPTGTRDVLAPESTRWQAVIASFAELATRAGFGLVVSPMFEDVGVFRHGVGEESDVVTKEMYEFEDKGGRALALRPEGTASIVRAFVQHRPQVPFKAWYATPAFRYERPQAGRFRQHHQLGVEVLGSEDPDVDVEVIALLFDFYAAIGLSRTELQVNSMGDRTCLPPYKDALSRFLNANEARLCVEHCKVWQRNPLRVLDCKKPECVAARIDAPKFSDALCEPCREHFARVVAGLDALSVPWRRDEFLVRGLDYYTRTTFEFTAQSLESSQNAIGGGGRYDRLAEALGGPATPGIGFGSGIERILLACDAEGALSDRCGAIEVFVVDLGTGDAARDLTHELRRAGISAERAFDQRSAKAQFRQADRSGARLALVVGPDERATNTVTVRELRGQASTRQETIDRGGLIKAIQERLQ